MLVLKGLILYSLLVIVDSWCMPFTYGDWHQWGSCTASCGGGTRRRVKYSCVKDNEKWDTGNCNEVCYNGGSYYNGNCHCTSWRSGSCCKGCREINIQHCKDGHHECGGSPDNVRCNECDKTYYSGGWGNGCRECPPIAQCVDRHCTSRYNTKCERCESNGILFQPTSDKTECERNCAWDKLNCWPGTCGDGLIRKCNCASGFHKFSGPGETSCQLDEKNTPTVNKCFTTMLSSKGDAKQTKESACDKVRDFYGNFVPHSFHFDMAADFKIDIKNVTKPAFIKETKFGVTDVNLFLLRELISGSQHVVNRIHLLHDISNGLNARETFFKKDIVHLDRLKLSMNDGERFCVKYEAQGGGYLKSIDLRGSHSERGPYSYRKTKGSHTLCYRYDNAKPKHCSVTKTYPCDIVEPLHVSNRILRLRNVILVFSGWTDPLPTGGKPAHASGIESFLITVNEVQNGIVDKEIKLNKSLDVSQTSATFTLPSDSPRLYCITLEVKDVADNVQQARRFVLYDSSSYIATNTVTGSFVITSASKASNNNWQTHHGDICLNWKSYFTNTDYETNSLLGTIKSNDLISDEYDQTKGPLPVSGTGNVFGIVGYWFSWSINNNQTGKEISIPDFTNQSYCHHFNLKDGQTYILNIRAVDIVNNTYGENRTVHIDRTVPHINNIGLTKNGVKQLFVHDQTDLSKMELHFEALDPHSGLLNIEWKFGTSDSGSELGSGKTGIMKVNKDGCQTNMSKCYCPDVGECETYDYRILMNKLVNNNTHIGNHNRNYFFTIKVTNNALLSNVEHLDILVDDSPPERGVIYEGPVGSSDIDYTSDDTFIVRWYGFIDHESGIKEYRLGMANGRVDKEELLNYDLTSNITNITEYATIMFTESSYRVNANFTGKMYVCILAINNAMEASDVACSDGITKDNTPPDLTNLRIQHARWSDSLYCNAEEAWLFRSDLTKMRLSDESECHLRCNKDMSVFEIYRILPVEETVGNDTAVHDFICTIIPAYNPSNTIYLPNDHIDLSWDVSESVSQIEDFYVGIGRSSRNISALSVMDYKSTNTMQHFKMRHIGVGAGDPFYVYIKSVNKAKQEKVSVIGPLLVDETPPYFREKPTVKINKDTLTVGWSNDTVTDPEQTATINQIFCQIVHEGQVVSPFLEWRIDDSLPCPEFTGGCIRYPLKKLQKVDTDLGLRFAVIVYAYNNAGHFAVEKTNTFQLPSRYPPGHAVVRDADPEFYQGSHTKDVDVHFNAYELCGQWRGFKHHENVSIEIGIGTSKTAADIIPFQYSNASNTTCIKSDLIQFNIQYFLHVRASCSGGKTISTSDGVTILNETTFLKLFDTSVGDTADVEEIMWPESVISDKNQSVFYPKKNIQVGHKYNLVIINLPSNVSVISNDTMLISTTTYNSTSMTMNLIVVPVSKTPCIIINRLLEDNITSVVYTTTAREYNLNSKTVVSKTNNLISVRWTYAGLKEILIYFTFDVTLAERDTISDNSHYDTGERSLIQYGHSQHFINSSLLHTDRVYIVIIKPCTAVRCIGPFYSREFEMESIMTVGNLQSFNIELDNGKKCVDVVLSWRKFEAKSNVTIYQWSISKDTEAKDILTAWRTVLDEGKELYNIQDCVNLPVHGHATIYLCVRAYSVAGNVVTTCRRASVVENGDFSKDTIYDIDASVETWNYIKQMIHSSNIGSKYSVLYDAEMDFGTNNTSVVGTLMYATERNVTWYLMKNKHLPFTYDCDKDSDCIHTRTTDNGYVLFDKTFVRANTFYYTCAYSKTTSVSRELFTEEQEEISSCSNGFIIDDSPPAGGHVNVENAGGFITSPTEIELSWYGFDDNVEAEELGYIDRIKYYSYSIGLRPGGEEITNYTVVGNVQRFVDRHQGIADGTGVYVSVKATDHAGLSKEVYSEELTVDATPPNSGTIIINGNSSYISAPTCELALFGFRDDQSGIDHFEVRTGSDIGLEDVRPMLRFFSDRIDFEVSKDMQDGHTYFISVKAVNRAGLSSLPVTASFNLDRSAPTGGHVLDGNWQTERDIDFQRNLDSIQGHWKGFTDPQSGIKNYKTGLGTRPHWYDIEAMIDVGLRTDNTWNGTYEIGKTYFITVEACNVAGLCRSVSSDGIVLDNSPPIQGIVKVGSRQQHQPYLPNGDSIRVSWIGFEDPQSGIDHYEYCIGTNALLCDITDYTTCLLESNVIKTGLNLTHNKNYYVSVKAFNKAGVNIETTSDTFTIDDTPPVLVQKPGFLLDYNAITGEKAQWDRSVLRIYWKFADAESKIASHTITLKTHHEGHTPFENIHVGNVNKLTIGLDDKNWLNNGDNYFLVVTSCNTAGLCSTSKSDKFLIDSSPPHQGGFKPPLLWQNFKTYNSTKSKITVSWYGFVDPESAIDLYYLTVGRNYTGQGLSGGIVTRPAGNNQMQQNTTIMLNEELVPDEPLILTIWAKNSAGLNSSVSRITVNVLSSQKSNSRNATGVLEIQKHSCDIHFCNKDCTCAIVGRPCVDVSTNDSCTALNVTDVHLMNLTEIVVFGGLSSYPQNITVSSACLSAHWVPHGDEYLIQRYEWSMGITDQPVGTGIFNLKSETPWNDVGKRKETVHCLSLHPGLEHDMNYQIYVRAWYSKNVFAEFTSAPIHVDQTPPHHVTGKYIKDSDLTCIKDYDVIDWTDTVSACWDQVFTEPQGQILHYYISLGTTINGSDIYQRTNVGLQTNISLHNLSLSHGTKYYITVTAYNNVGLHTTLNSDGFVVDMDKPIAGVVFNTEKHTDTTYQSSSSTFSISWHGFIDHFSGIKSYHVAVVENSTSNYENVSFINVGLQTKHKFNHLSLTHTKSYKGLAVDSAGHVSEVAISVGKIIDITAPEPFHCQYFETVNISLSTSNVSGTASFYQNTTQNNYYVIKGVLEGVSINVKPLLSVGRYQFSLPVSINNNGSVEFENSFLSPVSGETIFSISAVEPSAFETNFSIHIEMLVCSSEILTTHSRKAVQLRQIGPSQLAVDIKILDRESSLYKVELGAGTTPGGFQLRPLTSMYGGTSGVIDIYSEHASNVYVTVVAENHAGLRSTFNAVPVTIDKTPPRIDRIESKIAEYISDSNGTMTALNISAKWNVADQESGVKYCLCGIGKLKSSTDIEKLRLADTTESCVFLVPHFQHGDIIFVSVRCINNVELATETVSDKIIVSTEAPKSDRAKGRFIVAGNIEALHASPNSPGLENVGTFIQTDRSKVVLEWSGFVDLSGIDHYEYRLMCRNDTVVGWRSSGKHTLVELKGLDLQSEHRYAAEVKAVNLGLLSSSPVISEVIVYHNEPKLTGKPLSASRNGQQLRLDWSAVFYLEDGIVVTYDVVIGSKQGFTDILQLLRIDANVYNVIVPQATIIAPNVQELFITITCTYATGLYTVYQTTYKM